MSIASVRVARLRRRSSGDGSAARLITRTPDMRVTDDPRHRGHGVQYRPPGRRYRPGHRTHDAVDDGDGQVVEALPHQVIGRQILRNG